MINMTLDQLDQLAPYSLEDFTQPDSAAKKWATILFTATRNKCIATSNKCLTTRNKKLLGAPGIATRSKDATRGSILFTAR